MGTGRSSYFSLLWAMFEFFHNKRDKHGSELLRVYYVH